MKLQLADNNKIRVIKNTVDGQTAIYNPSTGAGMVIQSEGLGRGIFGTKKTRTARRQNKEIRKINRQEAKTGRQGERFQRKDTRLKTRTARKESGLIKVVGKRDVIKAKQDAKIRQAQEQVQGSKSSEFTEDNDNIPSNEEIYGGEFLSPEQSAEQDNETFTDYEEQYNDSEQEDGGGAYDTPMEDGYPLNGWVSTVIQGASKLLTKAKDTKVGTAVTNSADYSRLKTENQLLQKEIESLKNQLLIYGGVGAVLGVVGTVIVKKVISK